MGDAGSWLRMSLSTVKVWSWQRTGNGRFKLTMQHFGKCSTGREKSEKLSGSQKSPSLTGPLKTPHGKLVVKSGAPRLIKNLRKRLILRLPPLRVKKRLSANETVSW